jgi:hypothetical protein
MICLICILVVVSEIATIIRKFPQKDRQRLEKYYISFF